MTWLAPLAAVAIAGCGGEGTETRPAPDVPPDFFGVNAQLLQPMPSRGQGALMERQLESLEGLGVDFVRANLDWQLIEPRAPAGGEHTYDFSSTDPWVAALARHGLRWQPTGAGVPTPEWARDPQAVAAGCDYRSSPARPADLAGLMGAIARRYGRDGSFWRRHPDLRDEPVVQYEVWNEPNYSIFWCPAPDPEAYGPQYDAVRAAVHAVDERAVVVFGGLAGFAADSPDPASSMPADEFLQRALAAAPGLASRVDAVGVHPYAQTPEEVLERLGWFRSIVDAAGLRGTPLSVNEFGWRTRGTGSAPLAPEPERAEYVAEVTSAIAGSSCDVIALALHTWITAQTNPVDAESWYGIADPVTGDPYETADAYRDTVAEILAGNPVQAGGVAGDDPCA